MAIDGIKVVGGRLQNRALTSSLDEVTYNVRKAHVWLSMLKDKMVPAKWFKPTKKGTKVSFNYPQSQKEWDDSFAQLKVFIVEVNEKHGTKLSIN